MQDVNAVDKVIPVRDGLFFLLRNGLLYSLGKNHSGHLGLKERRLFESPAHVALPADETVVDVQSFIWQTLILTAKGHVYVCGGLNDADRCMPTKLVFPEGIKITKINITKRAIFFITATNKFFVCENEHLVRVAKGSDRNKLIQVELPENKNILDVFFISRGTNREGTFFLTTGGEVYASGYNAFGYGYLGLDDDKSWINIPSKINVPGNKKISSIITSKGYDLKDKNIYLITDEQEVFGFGSNKEGLLGLGHSEPVRLPVKIKFPDDQKIAKIVARQRHIFFLSVADELYACGKNKSGCLGVGHNSPVYTPTKVLFPEKVRINEIVMGGSFLDIYAFFLTLDGKIYISGSNPDAGKRGRKLVKESFFVPTEINFPNKAKMVGMMTAFDGNCFFSDKGELYVAGPEEFIGMFGIKTHNFSLSAIKDRIKKAGPIKSPVPLLKNNVQAVLYLPSVHEKTLIILKSTGHVYISKRNALFREQIFNLPQEFPDLTVYVGATAEVVEQLPNAENNNNTFEHSEDNTSWKLLTILTMLNVLRVRITEVDEVRTIQRLLAQASVLEDKSPFLNLLHIPMLAQEYDLFEVVAHYIGMDEAELRKRVAKYFETECVHIKHKDLWRNSIEIEILMKLLEDDILKKQTLIKQAEFPNLFSELSGLCSKIIASEYIPAIRKAFAILKVLGANIPESFVQKLFTMLSTLGANIRTSNEIPVIQKLFTALNLLVANIPQVDVATISDIPHSQSTQLPVNANNNNNFKQSKATMNSYGSLFSELNIMGANLDVLEDIPTIPNFDYLRLSPNGNRLFEAVAMYIGKEESALRRIVAWEVDNNWDRYKGLFVEVSKEDYIHQMGSGRDCPALAEIEILMRVLDRPILQVKSKPIRITNVEDIDRPGKPIYVYDEGNNHYGALLLKPGASDKMARQALLPKDFSRYSPRLLSNDNFSKENVSEVKPTL